MESKDREKVGGNAPGTLMCSLQHKQLIYKFPNTCLCFQFFKTTLYHFGQQSHQVKDDEITRAC